VSRGRPDEQNYIESPLQPFQQNFVKFFTQDLYSGNDEAERLALGISAQFFSSAVSEETLTIFRH